MHTIRQKVKAVGLVKPTQRVVCLDFYPNSIVIKKFFIAKKFFMVFNCCMKIPLIKHYIQKNTTVKPQWRMISENDTRKVFDDIPIKNDILGNLTLSVKKYKKTFNMLNIEIKNVMNKVFGEEILSINNDDKTINGINIYVNEEYRRKNYRFGELLRLASIMEMFENKSSKIDIYSKGSAVYFHSKYKFKPSLNVTDYPDEVLSTLDMIEKDKRKGNKQLSNLANLYKRVLKSDSRLFGIEDLKKRIDTLVQDYILKSTETEHPEKIYPFRCGIHMSLSAEDVKENRKFFNELFKKHGIDYKV